MTLPNLLVKPLNLASDILNMIDANIWNVFHTFCRLPYVVNHCESTCWNNKMDPVSRQYAEVPTYSHNPSSRSGVTGMRNHPANRAITFQF